eukprot:scaffold56865_cov71-Phaeocystis_antarctica.AAC.6
MRHPVLGPHDLQVPLEPPACREEAHDLYAVAAEQRHHQGVGERVVEPIRGELIRVHPDDEAAQPRAQQVHGEHGEAEYAATQRRWGQLLQRGDDWAQDGAAEQPGREAGPEEHRVRLRVEQEADGGGRLDKEHQQRREARLGQPYPQVEAVGEGAHERAGRSADHNEDHGGRERRLRACRKGWTEPASPSPVVPTATRASEGQRRKSMAASCTLALTVASRSDRSCCALTARSSALSSRTSMGNASDKHVPTPPSMKKTKRQPSVSPSSPASSNELPAPRWIPEKKKPLARASCDEGK